MKFLFAAIALFAILSTVSAQTGFCTYCETAVELTEVGFNEFGLNATEIENSVAGYCNALPSPFNAGCMLFVNEYIDTIINEVASGANPDTICAQLELCSTKDKVAKQVQAFATRIKKPAKKMFNVRKN